MAVDLHTERGNAPEQPTEAQAIVRYANALFSEAYSDKAKVKSRVDRWQKMWKGEHWSAKMPKWKTKGHSNFVFSLIETQVTWLAEQQTKIVADPLGPEDTEAAEILEKIIKDFLWPELQIRPKVKRMVRSALVRGRGFMKVGWDPHAITPFGLGEITVDYVPWSEIYLDPQASDYSKGRYMVHARYMPVSEIVRKWPEEGWRLGPGGSSGLSDDAGHYSADTDRPIIGPAGGEDHGDQLVLVKEIWIKDDSVELQEEVGIDDLTGEPLQDDDGNPVMVQVERQMYPAGRRIIVAEDVLLDDGPNPFQVQRDDDIFPFVSMSAYEDDDSIWDLSEVSQLESPQRVINMLMARMVDYARQVANTPWIKDDTSGVNAEDLTNQEGLVITKRQGTEVRRDPPPPLPSAVFQLYMQTQRDMEMISGIHEITQGRKPGGVTAASAISQLQEAGQARIRDKARNRDDAVQRLGRLLALRVLQFYGGRMLAIRGDAGPEYVQFDPSQVRVGVDIRIIPGTSLDMNEQLRFELAKELFQGGAIDQIALLKTTNFPDAEDIIQRMQAAAAAPPPPEVPPGPGGPAPPMPGGLPTGPGPTMPPLPGA